MPATKAIAPKKSHHKKKRRKDERRKLADDLMLDLINCLESLPAVSYVFLGYDNTCAMGPTAASAVDLVLCGLNDSKYEGPYPASAFQSEQAQALDDLPEIVKAVKKRLRRLCKAGVGFILCWHAYGQKKPHLDWHGDYSPDSIAEELSYLLQEEVGSSVRHC